MIQGLAFESVPARVRMAYRLLVARTQAELLARLDRRQRTRAHELDDLDRLLDELAVGGEDALLEKQVVLKPDADVAAEQDSLRHHRHLHAADAESGPMAVGGQLIDEGLHRRRIRRRAPGNAEADLEQRRLRQQPFLHHLLGEPEMAGIEYFELRLDAELVDPPGALAQILRRGDVDHVAVAEIQRAAIERANFRQQLFDMDEPLERSHHVRRRAGLGRLVVPHLEVATHAGGEIDHHVGAAAADALDDFAVEGGIAAALAGLGIAHVDVGDRGAGLGRLDGGIGDLLGGHGNGRMLAHGVAGAGNRAADDDLGIHGFVSPSAPRPSWPRRGMALATPPTAWREAGDAFWLADDPRPLRALAGQEIVAAIPGSATPVNADWVDRHP